MTKRLVCLLLLALFLRLAFFAGLRGSDDLQYAVRAKSCAEGAPLIPSGPEPFEVNLRPALAEGTAASLRLAGRVSEAGLVAYPMACSLALVVVLYLAATHWVGAAAGLATGLVASFLPGFVLAATSLYSDLPMTLWTVVSLFLLWGAPGWGGWARPAACAAGLAFALAAHHKETALLLLPVLGWLALTTSRRALAGWVLAALTAGIVFGWSGYLISKSVDFLQGQASFQWKAPPEQLAPAMNPTMGTDSSITRRLLWDFTSMLVDPREKGGFTMWSGVAFLAAGGAWLGFRGHPGPLKACTVWAALAFLSLNFAGIPGPGYTPMHPVSPRYLMLVMPPLVILAGTLCAWAWARLSRPLRWGGAIIALLAALAFNLLTTSPNQAYSRSLRLALPVIEAERAREVWTDRRTAAGLRLFLDGSVRIHDWGDPGTPPPDGLVVVNGPMLTFLAETYGDPLPDRAFHPPPGWSRLAGAQVSGIPGRGNDDPRRCVTVYRAGPGLLAVAGPPSPGFGITFRQRVVVTLMSLGLIVFIFELVRRRRLREEYSWLWMLSAGVILLFALYHPALLWVTQLIGAGLPTSTLFLFGLFFLILISIHYAVKISSLTMQLKNLHQELAMLKDRLARGEAPPGPPDAP